MTEQQKALVDMFKSIGALAAGLSAFVGHIVQIRQAIKGEPHWLWLSVFVALTVIVCIFVVAKKTTVGAMFGQPSRIHLFRPWSRLTCKIILGLIAVSPLLFLLKPSKAKSFDILVANIDGPTNSQYRVTESLIEDLSKATAVYPNVKIKTLSRGLSPQDGSEVARAYGITEHADVVIWGWFATSKSKIRITLHCELLGAVAGIWKNSTDQTGVFSLSQLENFELQKELGDDMTALALFFVGQSRLKDHDDKGAVEVLSRAVGHLRDKGTLGEAADIYFSRGYCYANMRSIANSRKAAEDYSTAISLRTNFTEAYIDRAAAYLNLGMYAEVVADCERALQLEPVHPVALANRSAAFVRLGRIDEAVRDAEIACTNVPWFSGYGLSLALALSAKGDHERAISVCKQVLDRNPADSGALFARAEVLRQAGRLDDAIHQSTELLSITNTAADAYCARGRAYWDKADYQKAADDFSAFLRFHPASAEVHCLRAQMYQNLGKHALTIADCDFAIAAKSNLVDTPLQIVYCLRGRAFDQLRDFPSAVTNFSMAIQFDANYFDAYEGRGKALLDQGRFTSAVEDFSRVIEGRTNSIDAFFGRGAAYAGLNMHSNAIMDLTTFISRNPTNLNAHVVRGLAYWGLGALSEAIRDCEKALHATNEPVVLENADRLWKGILDIAQDSSGANQAILEGSATPWQKQVHGLLIRARAGSLTHYMELCGLSEGTNALASSAKAGVEDVALYFDVYRDRTYLKRRFLDPVRLKPMAMSVDQVIFNELTAPDWTQRATAVSYLAGNRKANTIPHLCDALLSETNLYVISDITKALNEMTDTHHGPLALQSVRNWWATNVHEKAYQTPFAVSRRYWNYLMLPPDQAKQALGALGQTIAAEPTAHWARCFRAGCHIVLHEFDLARKDLVEVEKASPQLCWLLFYRTLLYHAEGKAEVVESLNELLAMYPGFEANARQILGTNVLSDPRIKWPQQKQASRTEP